MNNRIHLFEFTDLAWYPQSFRRMQTDYLQFAAGLGSGHKNLVPLFQKALRSIGTTEIVDLCSGGSGPWLHLCEQLRQVGFDVHVTLTDKYPAYRAGQRWPAGLDYLSESVDATRVPPHLGGMRTLFEGFHHFQPQGARAILQDALDRRVPIGIFEASLIPPFGWLLLLISPFITLLTYLLVTPWIKPRRFSRFLWTYLIPIVPLATCWDGVVSLLRVYSVRELQELTRPLERQGYVWEAGLASTGTPVFAFTYLLGYPE